MGKTTRPVKDDKSPIENIQKKQVDPAVFLKKTSTLKTTSFAEDAQLTDFVEASYDKKALLLEQFARDKNWKDSDTEAMLSLSGMMRVALNQAAVVAALDTDGVKNSMDLKAYDVKKLSALLTKQKVELPDAMNPEDYSRELLYQAENEHPTAFFMHRLLDDPGLFELDKKFIPKASNAIKTFYKDNPGFDLLNESLFSAETGLPNAALVKVRVDDAALWSELSAIQQALRLGSNANMSAYLLQKGVDISYVVQSSNKALMRELDLDAESVDGMKQRAMFYHTAAMNGYFAFRDIISNPFLKNTLQNLRPVHDGIMQGIGKKENWKVIAEGQGLKEFNTIEDLFGDQNYCTCTSCRSVLSPAAYFVDLMRFLEQRVLFSENGKAKVKMMASNHPIHLRTRRPDLWNLPLTCENTNDPVPYVKVINEVLAAFIVKHAPNGPSITERLRLSKPDMEFSLPYNHTLEEVRSRLRYLGTDRSTLLQNLLANPNPKQRETITSEVLGLSPELFDVITNDNLKAEVDANVLTFMRITGMEADAVEQLAAMHFWKGKFRIAQIDSGSDLQKFHLVFHSDIPNWQGVLHRFYRLLTHCPWNIQELNAILFAAHISYNTLDKNALHTLRDVRILQIALQLDVRELIGVAFGYAAFSTKEDIFSWNKILPDSWLSNANWNANAPNSDEALEILADLKGVFQTDESTLISALSFLKNPAQPDAKIKIDDDMLDSLYRHIALFVYTGLDTFDDLIALLSILQGDTAKPLAELSAFLHTIRTIKEWKKWGIQSADLVYLQKEDAQELADAVLYLDSPDFTQLRKTPAFVGDSRRSCLFNAWTGLDTGLVEHYLTLTGIPLSDLNSWLEALDTETPPEVAKNGLGKTFLRINKVQYVMDLLQFSADECIEIALRKEGLAWLDLGFTKWEDMQWMLALAYLKSWQKETSGLRNFDLFSLLSECASGVISESGWKNIIKWTQTEVQTAHALFSGVTDLHAMQIAIEKANWCNTLGVSTVLLQSMFKEDVDALRKQSRALIGTIRSRFSTTEAFEASVQDNRNALYSSLRDATCNYVLYADEIRKQNFGFDDMEDLYRYFLLDVSMGDCFTLPRIVAATNSVQVYIHRCLMGLEQSKDGKVNVLLDMDEKEEWEWRKNYRVWEANRKIFLYPENYLEPEIRDNKTPQFTDLEDTLLQQKLNTEVVENAYKKYIQEIMELAELKIVGAYHDKAYDRIYLFGKTNKQPAEFYFRHVEFLEQGGALWSNWVKMNVSISAEDVSAIRYNSKLYLFWTSYQRKDITDIQNGNQEIRMHTYDVYVHYTWLQVDDTWTAPQRIDMKYRKSSPFDPFLRLEQYKSLVNNNNTLKEQASEIRENVLKEFEKVVYRKPYPVATTDKNLLRMDFIWTDKKNALQPVYKDSRVTIDAITLNLQMKMAFMKEIQPFIEFNMEFAFDRFDEVIYTASGSGQSEPPSTIPDYSKNFTFHIGDEPIPFTIKVTNNGTKYQLRTGNTSGNKLFFFKEPNKEVSSGSADLMHHIDYIPVNEVDLERTYIKLADQKLTTNPKKVSIVTSSLKKEYNTYFDSFTGFYVTDGTDRYADGADDYKIRQKDMVATLSTPSTKTAGGGIKLNPEQIHLLWDKISVSVSELLDLNTQRHVSYQFDYSQNFGNYFYELFFHIPMRIAGHLNAAGKYREANQWYSYIFDPTAVQSEFERLAFPYDMNWRFAAFRNIRPEKLKAMYGDPNTIEMYQRNPGNPHAIARLRVGAYQKNVVMKYLDNLLDWADQLFTQYTPESTSEARHLYDIVKTILGDKPVATGKCKEVDAFCYADLNMKKSTDFIYNFFLPDHKREGRKSRTYGKRVETKRNTTDTRLMSQMDEKETRLNFQMVRTPVVQMEKMNRYESVNNKNSKYRVEAVHKDKYTAHPMRPQRHIDLGTDLIFCFPHNADFITYWDRVQDRIYKLNHCLDINGIKKTMPAYAPPIDPAMLARMVAAGLSFDDIMQAIQSKLPAHRFTFLLDKAKQFCSMVQSFGAGLFSAMEKKDVEELTLLRARHEQNILKLTLSNKKRQVEHSNKLLAQLMQSKISREHRRDHYQSLVDAGLSEWELAEQIAKWISGGIRGAEGILQSLSGTFHLIPQVGSPFAMKYGGLELGDSANMMANFLESTAKIADNVAHLAGVEGSHQRREQDWKLQVNSIADDLKELDEQIRAAEISVAIAEHDQSLQETSIEQYSELYDFYTTKFSNLSHYTFQAQQLQKLFRMAYNLAHETAMQAQQAFLFERPDIAGEVMFIQPDNWSNEHAGLLSGERLMLQLMQMEKQYVESDVRKIEITQHFSMLQIAPEKLLELKMNGVCADFSIPEAAFDLMYPGYYRRVIKSVRLSMPCITGPYTNIGATLQLQGSKIRRASTEELTDFHFTGSSLIATSNAQNDGGQFELTFKDDKYLPFEGSGAVSTWSLSLPKARRSFDYSTIADVIFHISYTAEYDGVFGEQVENALVAELNKIHGIGLRRIFSLKNDFASAWQQLRMDDNAEPVIVELQKFHFPYFSNVDDITGVDSSSFILKANSTLEKVNSSNGIKKAGKMKLEFPAAIGKTDHKDILFLVNYKMK